MERRPRHDRGDGAARAARSATSTSRSPTTRRAPARRATCRSTTCGGRPTRSRRCASGYPDIAILHGCEVDILPDGRLDFPDRVLEQFDIVLASLHDRAGQAPEQLLRRYLDGDATSAGDDHHASDQPARPAPRRLRPRLRSAVRRRGRNRHAWSKSTARPSHLDLDGALARRAMPPGATVAVDSDSHRADVLGRQMELGVDDRAPRLGRGAPRDEHAAARGDARAHRAQARALNGRDDAADCCRRRSACHGRQPSRSIARPCCPASTSATPRRSRPWRDRRSITPRDGYPLYFAIAGAVPAARRRRCRRTRSTRLGGRGGGRVRPAGARRRRAVGIASSPASAARCSSPGRTRSGARRSSPRSTRCTSLWSALTLWLLLRWEQRPTLGAARRVLRRLRARLRQSPLDDSAGAGLRAVPAGLGAGGWRSLLRAARDRARRCASPPPARCSTRWNLRTLWFAPQPPRRLVDALRHRSGSTSPRPTGATRWCCRSRGRWPATRLRCTASTCASSSAGPGRARVVGLAALVRATGAARR